MLDLELALKMAVFDWFKYLAPTCANPAHIQILGIEMTCLCDLVLTDGVIPKIGPSIADKNVVIYSRYQRGYTGSNSGISL